MANGFGGMMPFVLIIGGAVALYLFGCRLGIQAICNLRGQSADGGGGTTTTPATTTTTTGATPTTPAPLTPSQISAASGFPAVTLTEGMQYIANQVVNDIDKNTVQQFSSSFVLNLEADILERHKDDLTLIYNFNGMSLQPMTGRALAAYSQLVITVAREHGLVLNPAYEAMLRSDFFAGSPVVQTVRSQLAVAFA